LIGHNKSINEEANFLLIWKYNFKEELMIYTIEKENIKRVGNWLFGLLSPIELEKILRTLQENTAP